MINLRERRMELRRQAAPVARPLSAWWNAIPASVDELLVAGGDARLDVDLFSRLNQYGCQPSPRLGVASFASSTASSISPRAYEAAKLAHRGLTKASYSLGVTGALDQAVERLRRDLKDVLGLGETATEVIFSPSGTDAALHALFVARTALGGPVVSILAAADLTGSGIPLAASARHFGVRTALNVPVTKGTGIVGFSAGVGGISLPSRGERGRVFSPAESDRLVMRALSGLAAAGGRGVLYAMDHSKFGCRSPSLDCLREIRAGFAGTVEVVIDACQGRLSRARLRWYLDQGFMVQITGSKFFTGPPFSGALLVPSRLTTAMRRAESAPSGLSAYSVRTDWPQAWAGVRAGLPDRANLGQWLRWMAALEEMRAYYAVPADFRGMALGLFATVVTDLIDRDPNVDLLPEYRSGMAIDGAPDEMEARTIFPFLVRLAGLPLSFEESTVLYKALNRDMSSRLPASAAEMERRLAAVPCHVGQPVGIPDATGGVIGALRISADARLVSQTWSANGERDSRAQLDRQMARVEIVLGKIALLLRHFDRISQPPEAVRALKLAASS